MTYAFSSAFSALFQEPFWVQHSCEHVAGTIPVLVDSALIVHARLQAAHVGIISAKLGSFAGNLYDQKVR